MSKITSGDPRPARGRQRQAELAAEMKISVQHNVAAMLAGLGREPTEVERMQAEMISSLFLRARRLRDNGRDDTKVLRQAAVMTRNSVFAQPMRAAAPGGTVRMIPPATDQD
jgi:hypothetical protein